MIFRLSIPVILTGVMFFSTGCGQPEPARLYFYDVTDPARSAKPKSPDASIRQRLKELSLYYPEKEIRKLDGWENLDLAIRTEFLNLMNVEFKEFYHSRRTATGFQRYWDDYYNKEGVAPPPRTGHAKDRKEHAIWYWNEYVGPLEDLLMEAKENIRRKRKTPKPNLFLPTRPKNTY